MCCVECESEIRDEAFFAEIDSAGRYPMCLWCLEREERACEREMTDWCVMMDGRRERAREQALERAMYIEGCDALQLVDALMAWESEREYVELLSL